VTDGDSDYLRRLDSLARFYNSQATAHIGYLITSIVIYCAIFNIFQPVQTLKELLKINTYVATDVIVTIVFFVIFVLWAYMPFSSYYQLGRTQFYMELSQIVWEHMKVNNPAVFDPFRKRATAEDMAIQYAVMTLLEARLYRSLWLKKHQREPPESHNGQKWLNTFYVNERLFDESINTYEDLIKSPKYEAYLSSYVDRPILGIWKFPGFDRSKLLFDAHSRSMKGYPKHDHRFLAFKEFLD
jgi:hypothetical protein